MSIVSDINVEPGEWYLRRAAAAILCLLILFVPLSAHEVIVEQIVDMVVAPEGNQLVVRLHVPLTVIGAAPLQVAAADIAHSLDIRQGDTTLAQPAVTGQAAADGISADLELRYAARADGGRFSARVNTFDGARGPVRTNVRYQTASDSLSARAGTLARPNVFSVSGPPVRVTFDPPAWDVVQQFASRGVRALTGGGDYLLMLLCLLLPLRRARAAMALFAAGVSGQAIAIAIALLRPSMSAESLTAITMIAASAVVIGALQNIVRAHWRWTLSLAFAFGALNGFTFGQILNASAQFAGAHAGFAAPHSCSSSPSEHSGSARWRGRRGCGSKSAAHPIAPSC